MEPAEVDPRVLPWVCEASKAIELKLVATEADVEDQGAAFHPEYTHQVVGQSENIYGYKEPKVKLFYSAARLNAFLSFSHNGDVTALDDRDGLDAPPDQPVDQMKEWLKHEYTSNIDEFVMNLENERGFSPVGELVHSYTRPDEQGESVCYEVYQGDATTPGLIDYHKRVQTFFIWFIEAAWFLDLDDDRWRFLYLFQRKQRPDGASSYCFVGALTLYEYYAYPENVRPRISQALVLPPFQRAGHGAALLRAAYDYCIRTHPSDKLVDIAVEDPSENFTQLRDKVDTENCWKAFPKAFFVEPYEEAKVNEIRRKLFLGKVQARKIFEILHLHTLNTRDADKLKPFRLAVKKRLIQPHKKQKQNEERQLQALSPEERAAIVLKQQELQDSLHKEYTALIAEYRSVLERAQL